MNKCVRCGVETELLEFMHYEKADGDIDEVEMCPSCKEYVQWCVRRLLGGTRDWFLTKCPPEDE